MDNIKHRLEMLKEVIENIIKNNFITAAASMTDIECLYGRFEMLANLIFSNGSSLNFEPKTKESLRHLADDFRSIITNMIIIYKIKNHVLQCNPDDKRYSDPDTNKQIEAYILRSLIQSIITDSRSIFDYVYILLCDVYFQKFNQSENNLLKNEAVKFNKKDFKNLKFVNLKGLIKTNKDDVKCILGENNYNTIINSIEFFNAINSIRNNLIHEGYFLAVKREDNDMFRIEKVNIKSSNQEDNQPNYETDYPLESIELFKVFLEPDENLSTRLSIKLFSTICFAFVYNFLSNISSEILNKYSVSANHAFAYMGGSLIKENLLYTLQAINDKMDLSESNTN